MSGVLAAVLSTALGGTAIVATRFLAGAADPITIGLLWFAGGWALLLPLALIKGEQWPGRRDWPAVIGLALLFFGLFPVLFNAALIYTTAARGALALSTTPLITMLVAALLRIESLTIRKSVGLVLGHGRRGDCLGREPVCLSARCLARRCSYAGRGRLHGALHGLVATLNPARWPDFVRRHGHGDRGGLPGCSFVGCGRDRGRDGVRRAAVGGCALSGHRAGIYYLWSFALGTVSPTIVALTVTVNPITAAIFGALVLGEPICFCPLPLAGSGSQQDLGPVDVQREAMIAAARWMVAV